MQKFTYVLLILLFLNLNGCSDEAATLLTEKQLIEQLKQNNALLDSREVESSHFNYPFSPAYLKTRHDSYLLLKSVYANNYPLEMLDYLIIEERFAERFFMWPSTASIISNWLTLRDRTNDGGQFDIVELTNWLNTVIVTLEQRYTEKLILDKIHLKYLTQQVSQSIGLLNQAFIQPSVMEDALIGSLERLRGYLVTYRARNSFALSQQPNGASWYQSKLNYYGQTVKSPAQWLNSTNRVITQLGDNKLVKGTIDSSLFTDVHLSNNWILNLYPITVVSQGLDWRHSYIDLVSTLASIDDGLITNEARFVAAILAQVDLGIHYQAWTHQHARNVLKKHFGLSYIDADKIIDYSVLYPAVLLSPFAVLN